MELDVLKEIHLDPKNIRLENPSSSVEADLMEDLFANEHALDMVEGICRVGYLTHETPVVVKRDGKYIIVEGNRRLAALKSIQNPRLVPDCQVRVAGLASLLPDKSTLARIHVMLAPSQDEADQLVAAIHTSNLRKPWTPARQAAFFQAQVDAGRSLPDLVTRYPTIDVKRFVLRAKIINLFKSIDYEDAALVDYVRGPKYKRGVSTLARIFESKDFLDLTGLKLTDKGELKKDIGDGVLARMATAIVKGMESGDLNTRSLNKVSSADFRRLMETLGAIKAGNVPKTSSSSTADEEAKKGAGTGGASDTADGKKPAGKPAPSSHLDVSGWQPPSNYPPAVQRTIDELSAIDARTYPNATYLLMRSALEKTIKSFAEARGDDIRASGHGANGFVQLGSCLDWLVEHVKKAKDAPGVQQCIQKVKNSKLLPLATKGTADAVAHNHKFFVVFDDVKDGRDTLDPIMKYLMKP